MCVRNSQFEAVSIENMKTLKVLFMKTDKSNAG